MIAEEFNPERVNAALRRLRELQPRQVTFNLDAEVRQANFKFGNGQLSPAEFDLLEGGRHVDR